MKQKILLLTNIYPDPSQKLLNNTSVCHYFAKEWVKMGYEVKVIYNYTIYIKLLHFISYYFDKFIANWAVGSVNTIREVIAKQYTLDKVNVDKIPIYKTLPRTKFPKKSIKNQISKIILSNEKDDFTPDIIIGHFHNPSIELVSILKYKYKAKGCVILHGDTRDIKKMYKKNYIQLINSIDIWGYRSIAIRDSFESIYGKQKQTFICYSGVPKEFLKSIKPINFSEDLKKFIYVGSLIKRKNPISLIYALDKVYPVKKFSITFVGEGVERKKMMKSVIDLNLVSNINFLGNISRKDVSAEIESSECFIMISRGETFGLVYLEAMAKGCITIGSINEGIDGVIIDGFNGFLCEAGNHNELAAVIKKINSLTCKEKSEISLNAIKTATKLTDHKVAKTYIESVTSFTK